MNTTLPPAQSWTNRYGNLRTITRVSDGVYVLEGYSAFTRGSEDPPSGWKMFDMEGGPFITTGGSLAEQLHEARIAGTRLGEEIFGKVRDITPLTPDQAAKLLYPEGWIGKTVRRENGYCYIRIDTETL
jgi:hypothetical protein